MKSNNFIPILAILIAVCGIVSAASADLGTVPWKGTVFIGEEDLDITAPMQAGTNVTYTTLAYFGSGSNPYLDSPEATVTGVAVTDFYVAPSTFNGRTGAWYVRDGGTTIDLAFYVESPSLAVKIWNIGTESDVTNKNVPRATTLDFKIDTNLYQIQNRAPGDEFDFDIEVTNPDGTTYDSLAIQSGLYQSIENVPVDSSLYYWANRDIAYGWDLEAEEDGDRVYETGTYRVKLACDQNSLDVKSDERTVTIASETLKISTKDEDGKVTRGNGFTVDITGQPKTDYYLFVKSTQTKPAPYIVLNQKNVQRGVGGSYVTESGKDLEDSVPKDDPERYYAKVTLDSTGKLSVGFTTTKDSDTKKYTIRVENKFDGTYKADEVFMTVMEGKVMIEAEGSGTYYLGDQIDLTGTSTDSSTVYFFITGPNLPSTGGKLTDPTIAVSNGVEASFDSSDLDEKDEFEFKWATENIGVDSGTYTIYAISTPNDKNHLADTSYATLSVSLKKPYLTASAEGNVANGDKLLITGSAGTEVNEGVAIWILGKNYATRDIAEVRDDATFEYELDGGITQGMASGQYYVVVQHPMYNNQFDVTMAGNYVVDYDGEQIFKIKGAGSLMGSDAAFALIDAIEDADIDDTYTSLQFSVDAATVSIDKIPDTVPGKKIMVAGETNLRTGDELLIEILSATFGPTKKTQSGEFAGGSKTVKVVKGEALNKYSAEFDTAGYKPDEYIIQVSGIVIDVTSARSFNIVAATPTPTPTPPTTVPTTKPTTPPTAVPVTNTSTPTPTPTQSPGMGALVALVGLGTTAYLIVRKD